MQDTQTYLEQGLTAAREASRSLARSDDTTIRAVLHGLAERALAVSGDTAAAPRKPRLLSFIR